MVARADSHEGAIIMSMDYETTRVIDKLKALAAQSATSSLTPGNIAADAHLINDCGLDSISMVDFVVQVEECFAISLSEEEIGSPQMTIASLAKLVMAKKQILASTSA
jgi:acyl carrier protein